MACRVKRWKGAKAQAFNPFHLSSLSPLYHCTLSPEYPFTWMPFHLSTISLTSALSPVHSALYPHSISPEIAWKLCTLPPVKVFYHPFTYVFFHPFTCVSSYPFICTLPPFHLCPLTLLPEVTLTNHQVFGFPPSLSLPTMNSMRTWRHKIRWKLGFWVPQFKQVWLKHVVLRYPYHLQVEPPPHLHSQNGPHHVLTKWCEALWEMSFWEQHLFAIYSTQVLLTIVLDISKSKVEKDTFLSIAGDRSCWTEFFG